MLKYILLIFSLYMPISANSMPIVIFDNGHSISTQKYQTLFSGDKVPDFRNTWVYKEVLGANKIYNTPPKEMFPITTELLTPRITNINKEVYYPLMEYPICVIGADDISIKWVKRNKIHLLKNKVHCMLIEAKNLDSLKSLMKIMNGIKVYPANGDVIAEYFKINHYPVYINERSISQ